MMLVTTDDVGIGKRLTELRNEHGYEQKYVAKKLGVTQGSVCNWECGRRMPRAIHVIMLAKLYGTDPTYILVGGKRKKPARHPFGKLIDGEELVRISFGHEKEINDEFEPRCVGHEVDYLKAPLSDILNYLNDEKNHAQWRIIT